MRVIIYEVLNNLSEKVIGPALRRTGKKLYEIGNNLQGQLLSQDRLTPSLRRLTYQGKQPQLQETQFVAPNATIIGDVVVGTNSSVWYGATILGTSPIRIGNNSIIQDRVHISRATTIGDNVFVGPNAILQGSILHNRSFVSMGATVRHATIHSGGFVAAGAVIQDNVQVKEGQIWAGNPGKFLRKITPLQREVLQQHLDQMHQLASIHNQQTQKTTRQVINGSYSHQQGGNLDQLIKDVSQSNYNYTQDDTEFIQHRLFLKQNMQYPQWGRDYEPYRYENKSLPQKFKIGHHDQQFAQVALKLKPKQTVSDRKPWTSPY